MKRYIALLLVLGSLAVTSMFASAPAVAAQQASKLAESTINVGPNPAPAPSPVTPTTKNCAGVTLSVGVACDNTQTNPIFAYLTGIINFFSGLVGLVVVVNIIIGGIQYVTSVGEPAAIKKAKDRISKAVVSLLLFVMAWGIISYLIPGKVFG